MPFSRFTQSGRFVASVCGLGLSYIFKLDLIFAVGLMIIAMCPGGVTSNMLAKLAGGMLALNFVNSCPSLLSIITVPILVSFSIGNFYGRKRTTVNVTKLGLTMFLITAFLSLWVWLLLQSLLTWLTKLHPYYQSWQLDFCFNRYLRLQRIGKFF